MSIYGYVFQTSLHIWSDVLQTHMNRNRLIEEAPKGGGGFRGGKGKKGAYGVNNFLPTSYLIINLGLPWKFGKNRTSGWGFRWVLG